MADMEFNLLDEPWIKVMKDDCSIEEVSLVDVLIYSHDYRRLAGELSTQDIAILRLLLAILHTVIYRIDENGNEKLIESREDALDRWKYIWNIGKLPETQIINYLEKWKERFWLFHPERPFYQVHEANIGTEATSAKLNGEISESNNKSRLFSGRTGKSKNEMSFSESARWLLYLNAFDDTSAKPKTKGLPSAGVGWLGKLGLIYADGDNLFETLMLNLVLVHNQNECFEAPKPIWELEHARIQERIQVAMPNNQPELLTLQSRRILLEHNEKIVTGYKLLGGDFFERENATNEQMTVWRIDEDKSGKKIVPVRHVDSQKQMWRSLSNIIIDIDEGRRPGVVEWLSLLRRTRLIDNKKNINLRIASVKYGDKDFFVTDAFGDNVELSANWLLDDIDKSWRNLVNGEIKKCDEAAGLIGFFAKDLCKAAGNDTNNSLADKEKERFYFDLDIPFRKWLLSIDPHNPAQSFEDFRIMWRSKACNIAKAIGNEMMNNVGNQAFKGRKVDDRFYSSPSAYNKFLFSINKCFDMKTEKGGANER